MSTIHRNTGGQRAMALDPKLGLYARGPHVSCFNHKRDTSSKYTGIQRIPIFQANSGHGVLLG